MGRPPNPPCSPRLLRMFTTLFMVVALLQTLAVRPVHAQNDPIFLWCSGDANYTATGQFKRNLDLLLTNLSTVPSTAARGHFQSASLGGTDGAAYGLAQCRADVLPEDCAACLNRTASEIVPRCPLRPVAAIRYDDCLLRYSDRPVLRIMEDGQQVILGNPQNTSDPSVFDQRLTELVTEITSEAAAAEGSSRFAVGIRNYSEFGDIYGLAQCTRDLLRGSCDRCLRDLTGNLPRGNIGGQVIAVSCMLRFETTPFFSLSILPPTSPPPLQNAPSPSPEEGGGNGTGGSPGSEGKKSNKSRAIIIAVMSVVAAALFLFGIVICLRKRRPIKRAVYDPHEQHIRSPESLLFDLGTLRTATGNFSDANKLGEGGFGPVYKGILQDGQQIAVKRLSMRSIQGLAELRNEVVFVAKLQHRNLVRLLGFCLEEEEKMVVYEYLPNTSLDKFLFDPVKQLLLDWERRYKLIEGIARGLVYLHEDSRLRIIHRDLKASNILLDEHMNPKISDFGLAKLCGVDDTHGNTSRIAGTFGYMAPEYAMHGQFSTKSDVFSFGVLALEIVTGRKNGTFHYSENAIELLNDVWHHWNEGTALRLLNPAVERYQTHEVLRCIHIGLLCIQDDPSERPNMSEVVVMLSSSSLTLPAPSKPAFIIGGSETSNSDVHLRDTNSARSKNVSSSRDRSHPSVQSANEVTISDVDAR